MAKRPAGCATWPTSCPSASRAGSASATPAGRPTARPTTSTRTPTSTPRATSPWSTTGSSTTPPRCGPSWPGPGVDLVSDTDTEVLAHLIGRSEADTLEAKVAETLARVEGTYGLAVVHAAYPDRIVVARNGSPLIIGIGDHEMFVASDLAALVRYTTRVAHLDDGELATITADGFSTYRGDLTSVRRDRHRPRPRPGRRTTPASTTRSCTRRCSSSLRPPSGCCAAGWTNGSAPRAWTASTWTPASCGRSGGSRCWAAARRTTSARWARGWSRSWRASRPTRRRPASSATATRSSSRTRSTSRSASPARPSTPCSRCRRSAARAAGWSGWSTWSARRSRGSATAGSTCTPDPRSRWPRPRR